MEQRHCSLKRHKKRNKKLKKGNVEVDVWVDKV
jgi:hypothetical protein